MGTEKKRAQDKAYRESHREQIREYQRKWRAAYRKANLEKARDYDRAWTEKNRERRLESGKDYRDGHRTELCERSKKWKRENPSKVRAANAANYARIQGKIIRPGTCSKCGRSDRPIEGHHYDYTKPLELTWTCRKCHKGIHRIRPD